MFTKFRELKTKDQQATSMELAEHAKMVMSTLDEGIKSLDDMDTFLTYLHEIGASHTKIPGFNRQYFWVSSVAKESQNIICTYSNGHIRVYHMTYHERNVRKFLVNLIALSCFSWHTFFLYQLSFVTYKSKRTK